METPATWLACRPEQGGHWYPATKEGEQTFFCGVLLSLERRNLPTHLSLCVRLLSPAPTTSGRKWTSQSPPTGRSTRRLPPPVVVTLARSGPPASRCPLPMSLSGPACRRFSWFWQRPFRARVKHSSPGDTEDALLIKV